MNLQSWLLLILVLAFCAYVVYTGYIKKSSSGCGRCSTLKSNKNGQASCSKSCPCHK